MTRENTNELIPLPESDVHLWLAYYDEIDDDRLHDEYRQVLSIAEREREPRFHFARDRLRYLVTRAMVRTVLSRYVPVRPADWIFDTNAYGRPGIANVDAKDLQLHFNISHTHSLIVLGITRGGAVGVDVENIRTRAASIDIADRYFARGEVAALAALPQSQQQYRFFEHWTFKESYIKARGMGLSLPLDKFGFSFRHERAVEIDIHPELADAPDRWRFWQFQPTPEYLIALCTERRGIQCPTVSCFGVVPMKSETAISMNLLRASL